MPIYSFEGVKPVVDPSAFIHPTATLIGDVVIGRGCLVGPGASLRGDIGKIIMHAGSNIQDNCTVHCFPGKQTVIEQNGHVGHGAVLHGCMVKRNALIGMNAVIMDDAVIGEESFVAAMAFVRAKMVVPPRSLIGGIPAKVMRSLKEDEINWKTQGTKVYQELAKRYLTTMEEVEPDTHIRDDRLTLPAIGYRPKHD